MLMTNVEISRAVGSGELEIKGLIENGLQGTSYDAHIGREVHVSHAAETAIFDENRKTVRIQPGEFAILVTHETFRLPMDIAANIGPKTYFTLKGLVLLAGLQIDPGFHGALRLAVYNSSPKVVVLEHLQEICTIQFFRLREAATAKPPVIPELVEGRLPRIDRDYFRELETQSLTEIGQELRRLAQSVGQLTNNVDELTNNVDNLTKRVDSWQAKVEKVFWLIGVPLLIAMMALFIGAGVALLGR